MSNFITLLTLYHTIHVWQHWIFTAFDTAGDKDHFGRNQLTLFGKTFDEISKNGLFSDKLDLSDQMLKNVECLKKYVEGVKASDNATQFLDECMQEADSTCKVFASQLDENIIATKNSARAIDQYIDSQAGMTKVMNTAINIGRKFVSVAGNMLTTLAITAAINLAIKAITSIIERQEKLREAAIEAGSALDKEVSSINDYKAQISSLKESLDEGNLSEQEAYDVRKQLIGIQDQLVEKFGAEAAGIDLVNGKYQEQLGLLDSIANQKATDYLSEHNEAIAKAQKRMTTQWSYQTGNEDDALSIMRTDVDTVKQLFGKYADQGVSIDTAGLPQLTGLQDLNLKITADPTQAKKTIEQLYSDIEKDTTLRDDTKQALQNKLSEWKQSAQKIIDNDGVIAETAAKYQIQLSDTWSELYKNLEDAQTEYNDAVAKGNDTAISAAIEKAKAARDALNDSDSFDLYSDKDKYVKQYLDSISDQLEESTKLKAAQIGLNAAIKDGSAVLTDYLDITKEDAKNTINTIKSSVQSLNGLDDLDLVDIGSLENAGTEITAYTKEQVQAYDNMKSAADSLGISMSDLIDILVKAGLITGESIKYTNEFTTSALSAATNATKAISLVTAAMQSQSTTAGVSSDSYSELIKEQGEYAAALDFENGYVKLNTDMAKKITQAKIDEAEANIKLAYSQNQMKYSQVKADLEALNTAVQQNGKLEGENAEQVEKARSELEAQSKQLRENCRNLQMQYSLLVQSSGAYQDWVNAQNATESGDMYDSIIKARQTIAEGLKNGKIGTEKFKAAVELAIPEDYQGDIAKYMKRLNRYFKQASDGSADASGLNNFLKDSIKAGLMSKDAKDQITIVANKTTKDFADALHLSMEDVQSIWGELQEYGWEFDWGSLLGNPVDNLRMQIDDIQDQMDALGEGAENSPVWQALNEQLTDLKEKLKETFSSADASQIDQSIEDIIDEATKANGVLTESQTDTIRATGRAQNLYDLAKAQEELTEKQKEYNEALNSQSSYDVDGNGKDNLDKLTAELQQAQDKVTELTQKKEQLKDPTPLEISTFALDYAQGRIDGVEHTAKETTQMLSDIGLTVDASQAQSEIDEQNQKAEQFTKTLSNVPVTLDTSTCQTKIANVSKAIDGLKREVPITLNFGVAGTVLSVFSGGLTVSGSKSKSSKSSTNTGTAAGTPNSHGGKTLVGEIGNELVVNPHTGKWYTVGDNGAEFVNLPHGAIVFDHEKTQRLLKNGFVGGYGDALVSGNAMDAGSSGVGSFVGTAGNNYMPGKNPLVKNTYKATKASTKATKDNSKALEENKKALEKQKTALEKQKTALEKESNKLKIYGQAAIDEIEKREKALNKEKEAQDKAFEAEIDHLNEIKDAKDKELDAETKRIKEEKDAKDKAWEKEKKQLEEKKEALQDANDEEDRAIKLAELKDALAKAQANRTVRIYNRNQGFIWAADQEAVNDAQTALDDQMRDWKRDDVIKAVEDEIDAIDKLKDAYDEETDNRLDDIDKEKEAFDEKIEAEIDDINKRKDTYDKAIEAEIEKLDEVKEKWNEAMSLIGTSWEDYQLQLAAAAHFTDMSLDGMSGEISGYKDDVLANMKEIGGVTDQIDAITESIEKLEEAISNAKDATSGGGGGSNTTDYSSLFPQGDGSDVGSGDDDSSSDGIVSKLENQRNAVENLRAVVEAASAQNKEYTKTEQELSKTLEDGNLVGAQRAGIMQEYTTAQGNTRQSFDLLIQKSKEYTQAIIDEKDISQGARDAEVASLAYLLERHIGTSDTITQILSDYATALTENTGITGEQYQNSIDMLLGVSDQAQLSGDQMQTVLEATTYAVASSTQMDNEQRQTQMDSLIALAQQHGISTEEIIGYLANADIKMEESGVKTKDAHEKISAAVKDACKSLCLDYNTVIQKVDEAIAAYKREQEEISKLVQARKQASVIANGFSVNGGGGSLATQRVARYATGVLNAATTHIAITDEKGPEIKMRKPSFGQYSLIEKGSSVIPAQPSANLWKFGLDPESFIASHMNQRSIKSVEITQPNMSSAPVVNVGDIQMYGVNDPDSFARVLHDRVGGIFAQEFSKR